MSIHIGRCLCGAVRYEVDGAPERVMICHCRRCQRATGSAFMIDAIYARERFALVQGQCASFRSVSEFSGKWVDRNFCQACGTGLYLSFERMPEVVGVYSGTLDDPGAVPLGPEAASHIFTASARPGVMVSGDMAIFSEGVTRPDGARAPCIRFDGPVVTGSRGRIEPA